MEFSYEVVETICVLSEQNNGWKKELNLVSWNNREPVYDIRTWSPDHSKMGKGVTLSLDEMNALKETLKDLNLFD
ncbi:MAG: hypothetical protein IJJ19_05670 [Erysipelotrichaceae bacterium]|nr:hypothetical protein [Erysipelotrichaceae bacterium]MBR0474470.1 hypothetical protein [Erysipelotrichaceae bacterium]